MNLTQMREETAVYDDKNPDPSQRIIITIWPNRYCQLLSDETAKIARENGTDEDTEFFLRIIKDWNFTYTPQLGDGISTTTNENIAKGEEIPLPVEYRSLASIPPAISARYIAGINAMVKPTTQNGATRR